MVDNGYFRIQTGEQGLASVQVDPAGKGHFGPPDILSIAIDRLQPLPETRWHADNDRLTLTPLEVVVDHGIEIRNRGLPDRLPLGQSMGQSFQVSDGRFHCIEVPLPTWNTTDSGATLRLRRDGPEGEIVAETRLQNVRDNAYQALRFDPQGPGTYYVELSEAKGTIGWWSSGEPEYAQGQAFRNGEPVAGIERALKVIGTRSIGQAEMICSAEARRLTLRALFRTDTGQGVPPSPWSIRVRWDNDGYDVSYDAVPFQRFFSDSRRLLPSQQLKRWKERGGRYELQMEGNSWIEADGTGDYDLRFHGSRPRLTWQLGRGETDLQIEVQAHEEGGRFEKTLILEVLPRG